MAVQLLIVYVGSMIVQGGRCAAEEAAGRAEQETIRLDWVEVTGSSEKGKIAPSFLPDVQGAKINAGKKTTALELDELPRITGNNYRQALSRAPGLVLTEETSPLVSIGYRGLDPYRTQFTQVLKDGVPIHADQFGYPEAYYTPVLDSVETVEFIRGGASLQYGPQPGGALNYVSRSGRRDRLIGGESLHTFGSENYYSTFNRVDGAIGPVGYYGYVHHRRSDGIRAENSDYKVTTAALNLVLPASEEGQLSFTLENYDESHGEPGGLTFSTAPGAVNYLQDRRAASRLFDHFDLDRKAASLIWDQTTKGGVVGSGRLWIIDYARGSRRQRGGGFGVLPAGPLAGTNLIERKRFTNIGGSVRLGLRWGSSQQNLLSTGAEVFRSVSPLTESIGATPWTSNGELQVKSWRRILYTPLFLENLFRVGAWKITPGVRVEITRQKVTEQFNRTKIAAGVPLGRQNEQKVLPLFGLGASRPLVHGSEVYLNVSESYRPPLFTQVVPQGGTTLVNEDLKDGRSIQYEVGFRGKVGGRLTVDASLFEMQFNDQFSEVALPGGFSTVMNGGRSVHRGIEASVAYDLLALTTSKGRRSLSFFTNAMVLDAQSRSGPLKGNIPQHAPDHLIRTGLALKDNSGLKLAINGTLSDDCFGDDGNTSERYIPGYAVWDLTGEFKFPRSAIRLIAGVNNLLDEDYYTRARSEGIDPAAGRNFYLGGAIEF